MIKESYIYETNLNFSERDRIIHNISVSPFNADTFDLAEKLYLCVTDGIDNICTSQNYACIFIYADHKLRYKTIIDPIKRCLQSNGESMYDIISGFDGKYGSLYYNAARKLNGKIKETYPDAITALNINYSDFCVLVPEGCANLNELKIFAECELKKLSDDCILPSQNETESYNNIKNDFEKKLYKTHVNKYNRHYDEYCRILEELIELDCEASGKKYSCMQIALQVLKTILAETHLRWIYDSGNIRDEDADEAYYYDMNYKALSNHLTQFISQAPDNTDTSDQIWQLIYVTDEILEAIIKCHDEKIDNVVQKNFYGFVPLIQKNEVSQEIDSLYTRYTNHYSPYFCCGFLLVPPKNKYYFLNFLPAYIHEFFHYIPPKNRNVRNETVTLLTVYAVMHSLHKKLFENNTAHEKIISHKSLFSKFVRNFSKELMCMCYSSSEELYVSGYNDSMDYIANMRDLIINMDFDKLYIETACSDSFTQAETAFLMSNISECRDIWDTYVTDYLNTFTMVIREIRSDISMCKFLDLSLSDYINIMVNEPDFAKLSVISTADSTILRFGFMTRYLYRCEYPYKNVDFNKSWIEVCEEKLMWIEKKSNNKEISNRINNLKEYLREYTCTSIEQNAYQYTDAGCSLFEKLILGKEMSAYDPMYNDGKTELIGVWNKYLDKYASTKIACCLRDIYKAYMKVPSDAVELLRLEYACRLLFRDMPEWCNN